MRTFLPVRNVAALWVLLAFGAPRTGLSQSVVPARPEPLTELAVGIFGSDRSSYNGPIIAFKSLRNLNGPVYVGLRVEFRDDDPSRGRVQSIGLSPEVQLDESTSGVFVSASVGVLVSRWTGNRMSGDTDLGAGLSLTSSFGLGITDGRFLVEARGSKGPGYSLAAISFGARRNTYPAQDSARIRAMGNSWLSLNGNYRTTPGFRGYSISYGWNQLADRTLHTRVSLGINFLDFGSWSTGTVTGLAGVVVPTNLLGGVPLELNLVPEAGLWLFIEPDSRVFPVVRIGVELLANLSWVGVVADVGAMLGSGPAGSLRALHLRTGVQIKL